MTTGRLRSPPMTTGRSPRPQPPPNIVSQTASVQTARYAKAVEKRTNVAWPAVVLIRVDAGRARPVKSFNVSPVHARRFVSDHGFPFVIVLLVASAIPGGGKK